jgi:hypothetical protein
MMLEPFVRKLKRGLYSSNPLFHQYLAPSYWSRSTDAPPLKPKHLKLFLDHDLLSWLEAPLTPTPLPVSAPVSGSVDPLACSGASNSSSSSSKGERGGATFFEQALRRADEEVLIGESSKKQSYTKDSKGRFVKLVVPTGCEGVTDGTEGGADAVLLLLLRVFRCCCDVDTVPKVLPSFSSHGPPLSQGPDEKDVEPVRNEELARALMLECSLIIGLHLDGAAEAAVIARAAPPALCLLTFALCIRFFDRSRTQITARNASVTPL